MRRLRTVGVALLFGLATGIQLQTEEQLECEQAIIHLSRCCNNFDPKAINCTSAGCGQEPVLTTAESRCLQGQTCPDLTAPNGMCEQVKALGMKRMDMGVKCP